MIEIDGSEGEGGGQILRSSLSLAICTQQPFRITNIRANREQPGLRRQHLTAVNAAAKICNAEVDGAELASRALTFRPHTLRAGDSISFDSQRPHRLWAIGKEPAVAVWTVVNRRGDDRSVLLHGEPAE